MKGKVKPVPDEYHTLTPGLTVRNAAEAIDFYKEAFGAQERFRMATPDGRQVVHAELKVGSVFDPSGHIWMLATHVEDLSPEEMRERARQAMEKMLQEAGRP
jgi:uncharacterized glyoxalase superfamily protein PhnB